MREDLLLDHRIPSGEDNIYQLLSVMQGSTPTESYTYDIVGNWLSSLCVSAGGPG